MSGNVCERDLQIYIDFSFTFYWLYNKKQNIITFLIVFTFDCAFRYGSLKGCIFIVSIIKCWYKWHINCYDWIIQWWYRLISESFGSSDSLDGRGKGMWQRLRSLSPMYSMTWIFRFVTNSSFGSTFTANVIREKSYFILLLTIWLNTLLQYIWFLLVLFYVFVF